MTRARATSRSSRVRMNRSRWPTSSRWSTSSLSEMRKFHVRGREIGEATGVGDVHLQDCRDLVGDAIDEVRQCLRGRGHSGHEVLDLLGVGDRLFHRLDRGHHERLGLPISSITMRRSPCSVICTVSPGRLMRSCTRAATPTRPMNCADSIGSSWSPLATTSATISPGPRWRAGAPGSRERPSVPAIVPSGYTIVDRSAMSGSAGGSSDLRMSSLRCGLGHGRRR